MDARSARIIRAGILYVRLVTAVLSGEPVDDDLMRRFRQVDREWAIWRGHPLFTAARDRTAARPYPAGGLRPGRTHQGHPV